MFIEEKDVIELSLRYRKRGHDYEAYTSKEFKALKLDEEKAKKYDVVHLKARPLTWGLYNELQEAAMIISESGDRQFNYKLYKENRLKRLLIEWDAKDKDGKTVIVNEKTIAHLSPVIAEAILRAYDEVSYVGEDEENLS